MRRLAQTLSLLPLLAPFAAQAQAPDPLCQAMRRVVATAQGGFDTLPLATHLLPGSVRERRGVERGAAGTQHAVIYALMLQAEASHRPNPLEARYVALHAEIARCFPEASTAGDSHGMNGVLARWTLPYAVISLRRDDGMGGASTGEVEIAIAARW